MKYRFSNYYFAWLALLPVAAVFFPSCACAQSGSPINVGKKEIIYSQALKENRTIWIYTPSSTSRELQTNKRYPVLYLLDGEAHFYSSVGIVQQLSQANGNGVLPEMIIVGIENTDRLRDLVPASRAGQKNPFVDFLTAELLPYIDSQYQTAPYRVLVGHSLGGLTVVDMLVSSPDYFNAYLAIDPSMWYQQERFLHKAITELSKQGRKGKRLFVGTANTMPAGMILSQLTTDRSPETQHIRSIRQLDSSLRAHPNGLLYAQRYYEQERHNSVPLLSEYDGLRFIFDYYGLDLSEKDWADTSALLASRIRTHYKNVSREMGYINAAPLSLVRYLAFQAWDQKQYAKAAAFLKLNLDSYPDTAEVHESYAGFLLERGDTAQAIVHFKSALQLGASPVARAQMEALLHPGSITPIPNLQQYIGVYILELYQVPIVIEVRKQKLWAKVPGQPDDELVPVAENVFSVKGKPGYTVTFTFEGGIPKEFNSVQPNGTFKAVFKSREK